MSSSRLTTTVAIFIFFSGLVNIISSIWAHAPARIMFLAQFIPLQVSNLSRTITVIIGILLIVVSRELYEKKRRAWLLAILLLIPSLITHLIKGLDVEETVVNLLALITLVRVRKYYYVQSRPFTNIGILKTIVITISVVLLYVFVGHYALKSGFRPSPTAGYIGQELAYLSTGYGHAALTPVTSRAHWFHQSISVIETASLIFIFSALFAPFVTRRTEDEESWEAASSLVYRVGDNAVHPLTLMTDKRLYFNPDRTAFVAYRVDGKYAVALGDPVGYHEEIPDLIRAFADYCHSCGLKAVWYSASAKWASSYESLGFKLIPIGEEAVIPLPSFSLHGSAMKDVRNAVSKAEREGVVFAWYKMSDIPWSVMTEINSLHTAWLKNKNMPTLHFSLEYFPLPPLENGYVLVGSRGNELVVVLSYFIYARGRKTVLDLMLKSKSSGSGVMEAAIAESARYFRSLGVGELNLSLAPLVTSSPTAAEKLLLKSLERWYKFLPLRAYKAKFNPEWNPKYLVVPSTRELPAALLSLLRLHLGDRS